MASVGDISNNLPHKCVPANRLKAYLLGQLSPVEIEEISAKTAECPSCQQLMAALDTNDDALLETVRRSGDAPSWDDALELADLLAAAELAGASSLSEAIVERPQTEPGKPRQVGNYLLFEPLGHGGMGTIWRAEHTELKRPVALKMLADHRQHGPSARARFKREMQAIGQLQHPNIVQALDAGEDGDQPFLAMELLPGVDAAKQVQSDGPLPIARACDIVRQACGGINFAHQQGLLHRDIKPSNLMLLPDGAVKVLDLGLARFAQADAAHHGSLTSESHALGTGDFVAPQQGLDPRAADERSDVYSLGCTLFFLLTGEAPFAAPERDTFAKKVMAHLQEPIPTASAVRRDVPSELDKIIRRAMAKQPSKRFLSAAEMATALQPYCQPQSEAAMRTVGASPSRQSYFTPAIAAAATALIMLLLFGVTLAAMPQWFFVGKVSGDDVENSNIGDPPTAPVDDGALPAVAPASSDGRESPIDQQLTIEELNAPPPARVEPIEYDWVLTEHEGQKRDPAGILIHGRGFCFLSGVQGKFHGWADKVLVDVNKDNVWGVTGAGVEFGVDIKARAFSVETRRPQPLSVGVNAYRWSPPSDGIRMLHKDEGICVLTTFVGGLKADDEFVGIEVGEDDYYWLRGKSNDTTSTAMATSVLLSQKRSLDADVRTYQWPSEMHRQPIRMIHSGEGICFLSLIRGRYATPEDAARATIGEDGYWYLSGGGEESPVSAEAISVRFNGGIVE